MDKRNLQHPVTFCNQKTGSECIFTTNKKQSLAELIEIVRPTKSNNL